MLFATGQAPMDETTVIMGGSATEDEKMTEALKIALDEIESARLERKADKA